MTLDGLEKLLLKHFPREKWKDGKIWRPKVNLVRYADDFIITGDSKELLENEVRPLMERFLKERGLALSTDKTRITHIDEGFDFLGQNLRKYDGNPFDPQWMPYFEERAFRKKFGISHQQAGIKTS